MKCSALLFSLFLFTACVHADQNLIDANVAAADDLEFQDNSLDAVMMVLTWHDFLYADAENGWSAIDEGLLIRKLCKAMKPGAALGLIDHVAKSVHGKTDRFVFRFVRE